MIMNNYILLLAVVFVVIFCKYKYKPIDPHAGMVPIIWQCSYFTNDGTGKFTQRNVTYSTNYMTTNDYEEVYGEITNASNIK